MPLDKNKFKYVVIGDGEIATSKLAAMIRKFGKAKAPIPMYFFAQDKKKADELAKKMMEWNETIVIAKIVEVVK